METDSSADKPQENNWSAYKRTQVRCKQASPSDVQHVPGYLDFSQQASDDARILQHENPKDPSLYQGPMFGISDYPGFLFMPQALSESLQTALAYEAVTEFCESPHATNIDLVQPKRTEEDNQPHETMWYLWKTENGFVKEEVSKFKRKYRTFRKLSWATTGYHYDWTARSYHEGAKSFMPESLKMLAIHFACTSLSTASENSTFSPSASIVNYYNHKSVMGGHRDDLEYALDKPVVSISLGLPAIFLLGGKTKDSGPVLPILVRPGDVLILGGDARLNFHGMAKVLPADAFDTSTSENNSMSPKSNQQVTTDMISRMGAKVQEGEIRRFKEEHCTMPSADDLEALSSFLTQHRININVRQVHKD